MLELLNNDQHRDLHVHTRRGLRWGDGVMASPATLDEFRTLQHEYPIVFQPDPAMGFLPVALFGLCEGENLYAAQEGWHAESIPLAMRRMPFSIGVAGDELRVMVDMASPRIARPGEGGEALFLPHGGQSTHLQQVNAVLLALHEGLQATRAFTEVLQADQLLEPFVLQGEGLPEGLLRGCYTIHEERLAALDPARIGQLHQADYLQPIYMALASLSNLDKLVRAHLARTQPAG